MSVFLDTTGNQSLAIGICDRCGFKFPIADLLEDGNIPGLRVCKEDWDTLDPYRLPAPPADNIVIPNPRPDVSVGVTAINAEIGIEVVQITAEAIFAGSKTITQPYNNYILDFTGTSAAWTLDLITTLGVGWQCWVKNNGSGTITLSPSGSDKINNTTSFAILTGQNAYIEVVASGATGAQFSAAITTQDLPPQGG